MGTLKVKVVPGSSRDAVAGWLGDELKVRVAAPPEGGEANRRLCAFLAGEVGLPRTAVTVTAGESSAHKTLSFAGLDAEALARRVAAILAVGPKRGG
jgi:uncharacterized protein (TIGR00251 family)